MAKLVVSSIIASLLVEVSTERRSGPFCRMRRSRASTTGACSATVSSSSASSTSSSMRQPLLTVRRASVVSMSGTVRPSSWSISTSVARRNGSLSSTLSSRLSASPRASPLPCRSQ